MIVLQIELMEPELMHEDAAKHGGKFLQELRSLSDLPGNGMICHYSFPSIVEATAFAGECFGPEYGITNLIKEVVPGAFYLHTFE